ncbi:hypothetical protein [Mesorhizobium sp.]|uniref:hypothetical protein n=1 Tax=Mesorhizobium sp. TaxID=1871066 RepID=UPI0025BD279F|nr:hypothetical protein [Mesorhizobium sp.]
MLINPTIDMLRELGLYGIAVGLKGSLNEYELDLLRQRSLSARYEKTRRGELEHVL